MPGYRIKNSQIRVDQKNNKEADFAFEIIPKITNADLKKDFKVKQVNMRKTPKYISIFIY